MDRPRFDYAVSEGSEIAYATIGTARHDLLLVPFAIGTFDVYMDEPGRSRLIEPLAKLGRVISFDPLGQGMSSRDVDPSAVEDQMNEVEAVLDAAGSTRTAIVTGGDGTAMAVMFAATFPERVSHLIIIHGQARTTRAEGYEWAMTADERRARLIEPMLANWGDGSMVAHVYFPILSEEDPRIADLVGRFQRHIGTPGEARPHFILRQDVDVRDVLPEVRAPTLVIDRPAATQFDSRHAQYLAEHIPCARLLELPGRDSMIAGDGVEATIDAIGTFMDGVEPTPAGHRALATVAFTDIVGSTEKAAALGDAAWRELLGHHDTLTRDLVLAHQGNPVKSTGDGFLATFDGPARAIRCMAALDQAIAPLGVELRAGVHTGEVEMLNDDIAGIAVHIGARIAALAGPREVLTSSTVRDLSIGSGIEFVDRGRHALKGVPEPWQLYAASAAG